MKLIPLIATKETINVKFGGVVTYETDQNVDEPGILLVSNESGEFAMTVVNQVHLGGPVKLLMRPTGQLPVKKFSVGDKIGYIAIF